MIWRNFTRRGNPFVRALAYLRVRGWRATIRKIWRMAAPLDDTNYADWVARYDTLSARDIAAIRRRIETMPVRPAISLLLTRRGTDVATTIRSVTAQLYPDWQLCIALGAEPAPEELRLVAEAEPRIRLTSGHALALATGSHVAIIGEGDRLAPHALFTVALEIARYPDAALIYVDHDEIEPNGERTRPFFKPDWNPDLFYAQDYIGRFAVIPTELVSGDREDRAAYDLILRLLPLIQPRQIRHIPRILLHTPPPKAPDAAEALALEAYFRATGVTATVVGTAPRRVIWAMPAPLPHVTLIIPTRDRVNLLKNCLDGILHRTDYPNLSVLIVDNDSVRAETKDYLTAIIADPGVDILSIPGPFNYSRLNNQAVASLPIRPGDTELLGLLNNDLAIIDPGWLREMVSQAARPGIGAVGAKLYYADDTLQHGGVMLGLGGVAGHVHRGAPRTAPGYFGRLMAVQNIAAVTAACLVMPRHVFTEIGGFDETELAVAFNDVDLCLKIRRAGYSLVWTPHAELYHLESASRGEDFSREKARRFAREQATMRRRWAAELDADPFYNPNLTLEDEQFGLAFPPRAPKPWEMDF